MRFQRITNAIQTYGLATVVVLAVLAAAGCSQALLPWDQPAEDDSASFEISMVVPDYEAFGDAQRDAGAMVVSPDTTYLRVVLDSAEYDNWNFIEVPVTPEANTGVSSTNDGQPSIVNVTIAGVPARYYDRVTLELLDSSNTVLTTGTLFDVDVQPFQSVSLPVTCFVAADQYDYITADGDSIVDTVTAQSMNYYKFYGYEGVEYVMAATSTNGTPDVYLFRPNGSPARTADGLSYLAGLFDSTAGSAGLTYTADMTGMYVVGVYGYSSGADFNLSVTSSGTVIDESTAYVQLAYGDLRNGDWDGALADFTSALVRNPGNGTAALGYAALRVAELALDSEMAGVVTNNLGIADYPTTLGELLSTDWLEEYVMVYDETYEESWFLPEIQGQAGYDGILGGDTEDGIIDPYEKAIAFAAYFLQNNVGFNDLFYTMSDAMDRILEDAKSKLEGAASSSSLELTWDMMFDTYAEAYDFGWPRDEGDADGDGDTTEPMVVVFGGAEIKALLAYFETIQAFCRVVQAYNYSLEREDGTSYLTDIYELYYDPVDGFLSGDMSEPFIPKESPFSILDFLTPTDDATAQLGFARQHVSDALGLARDAVAELGARIPEDGYFLTAQSLAGMTGLTEAEITTIIDYEILLIEELQTSLEPGSFGYFPLMWDTAEMAGYVDGTTPWPTAPSETAGQLNIGAFFAAPLTGVIETTQYKEPVWYVLDETGATPTFRKMSVAEQTSLVPSDTTDYWIHMPESVVTAVNPLSNAIADDPATRFQVGWLSFQDENDNGLWDWYDDPADGGDGDGVWDTNEGEQIWDIGIRADTDYNGLYWEMVDVANLDSYTDDLGNPISPEEYYNFSESNVPRTEIQAWLESFASADSPLLEWTTEANLPGLYGYLTETNDWGEYVVWMNRPDYEHYFPAYKEGDDLYFNVPAEVAWHSVTTAGTVDPDTGIESTGTVWFSWTSGGGF